MTRYRRKSSFTASLGILVVLLVGPGIAYGNPATELPAGQRVQKQLGYVNMTSAYNNSINNNGTSNASGSSRACTVQLPVKLTVTTEVTLSSACPVHSDGCTGPADALPYQGVLTPCCNAHDWCYVCGYTKGLTGLQGRRLCDTKFRSNMIAVCKQNFNANTTDRDLCISTADTMYAAVTIFQESRERKLDSAAVCPGAASRLAAVDFCFTLSFEAGNDIIARIQPGNGGPWGAWAKYVQCPQGSWASSLATRVQPYQGLWSDDTGLSAVRMYCTDSKGDRSTVQPLESHPGTAGDWSGFSSCPVGQYIIAIRLQVEANQGLGDDTAAGGLRALCSDGVRELYNSNSLGFGVWGEWVKCPLGSAVCGFRIKTEQAWALDNTAMNDIQADCCSMGRG